MPVPSTMAFLCGTRREQASKRTLNRATNQNVVCLTLRVSLTLVLMAVIPLPVGSYPEGPPKEACQDMSPQHGGSPKPTRTSPYEIIIGNDVTTYSPNIEVRVRIEGTKFDGFMLQVRRADGGDHAPVGVFEHPPPYSHYLTCHHPKDTVTHANKSPKWNMEFSWRPPDGTAGPVFFIATLVFQYDTYWMNVTSDVLWPRGYPEPETTSVTSSKSASSTTTSSLQWEKFSTPVAEVTLAVSKTTSPWDKNDVETTKMTSRPIILEEDQYPLISAASGHLQGYNARTLALMSLLLCCSIRWYLSHTSSFLTSTAGSLESYS